MFDELTLAPPDAIFGVAEAFSRDPNPDKISLAVGVYRNAEGLTPVFEAVKTAERELLATERSKSYLPMQGSADYADHVQELLFGARHPARAEGRIATVQTPGGTGALRVVADFVLKIRPEATIHLTDPTWANHSHIFSSAGFLTGQLPYFDRRSNDLDFGGFCESLERVPDGNAVVLHGCCHNPTGVDPDPDQWAAIGKILGNRDILVILDFAYQGFANGLDEDAGGVRALAECLPELAVCSSFSKNFGLYNERVGSASILARSTGSTEAVLSHLKKAIRANYSNPPAHGGAVVAMILGNPDLRSLWEAELTTMRERVRQMRYLLASSLDERGVALSPEGNGFMTRQNGMFSFSGLTLDQVQTLRERFSIYIVDSGRINVAGLTRQNLPVLCDAIASVMGGR